MVVRLSPNWVRASCTDQCFIKNGIKWFSSSCGRVGQLILLDDVLALVLLPSISNYALVLDIGEGGEHHILIGTHIITANSENYALVSGR